MAQAINLGPANSSGTDSSIRAETQEDMGTVYLLPRLRNLIKYTVPGFPDCREFIFIAFLINGCPCLS